MKKIVLIIFFMITVLGLLARFIDYPNLVNFHGDPPLYMHDVKDMVDSGSLRLVGPPVMSKEVMGRMFFTGPFHYYVLASLGLLTHWNIYIISAFYTLLLPGAFILLFFWIKKKFGDLIAIVIYPILVFFPFLIVQSRGIWNPHFIPLFGGLFLLFLVERKKLIYYLLAGFFLGLGINVHYSALLWVPIAAFYLIEDIRKKHFNPKNWLLFVLGVIVAEFPFILFELRHNFYNIRTVIFHFKYGSFSGGYTFALGYYYIFSLFPFAVYLVASMLNKIKKTKFYPAVIGMLGILSLYLLVISFGSIGKKPLYPPGWIISRQKDVVEIIKKESPEKFEVAETINSDTRALEIRWWLRQSGIRVMGVTEYKTAPILYLVTTEKRPPENETVWEVDTMRPFKTEYKKNLGEGLYLFKLVRQ